MVGPMVGGCVMASKPRLPFAGSVVVLNRRAWERSSASSVLALGIALPSKLRVAPSETEHMLIYLRTFFRVLSSWVHRMSTLSEPTAVGLFEGVSFDGGQHWTRQIIGDGDQLGEICCDEQLAWDSFGNLWMVYLFIGSNGNVPIALSTDGGLTWEKVAEIVPIKPKGVSVPENTGSKGNGLSQKGIASADQPSISAGAGSVWVSYTVYPSTVVQAFGAPVTGLGRFGDFTTPQNVPTAFGKGKFGDTAVGPDGQVMAIYQDQTIGQGGARIYTALDPDGLGSAGFGEPRFFARTRVGGFDYLPVQPIDRLMPRPTSRGTGERRPQDGRVYAVWTQEVKNESDDMDIMFQFSDDDGATWTAPVRLNDDATRNSQVNSPSRWIRGPASSPCRGTTRATTSARADLATPTGSRTTTSRCGPPSRGMAGRHSPRTSR
jgi:hypothetical protein